MSFLLPRGKHWSVANWISHGFFADAQPFLTEAPSIAEDIKFCIATETDTLDLRSADQAALTQLLILVDSIIAATLKAGPSSLFTTDAFSTYVQQLEQLRDIVSELVRWLV